MHSELPNLITLLAGIFHHAAWTKYLIIWENVCFALIIVIFLTIIAYFGCRKRMMIPAGRLQNALELFVSLVDDFVCGILGKQGRKYVPFIGTLFIYILCMNLAGLIPFMRSATSSLSTTFALALCVFLYVHYSAIRELGFIGYIDHLMGKPRGALALTIVLPLFMFLMHIVSELIKPVSLSLRLRSNIFADDTLLAALSAFGIKGLPLLLFCTFIVIISAFVQAMVFSLLSTIYFALFLVEEEHQQAS
ncbi:MAG: F0F1 ATP synthase subunit A [Candidatus Omnitrophota bacterium]